MMVIILKRGDYRLGQGQVENYCEYAIQLFCASSENTPWNTVGPLGLAGVDLFEDLTYPGPHTSPSRPGMMLLLSRCA